MIKTRTVITLDEVFLEGEPAALEGVYVFAARDEFGGQGGECEQIRVRFSVSIESVAQNEHMCAKRADEPFGQISAKPAAAGADEIQGLFVQIAAKGDRGL